MTRKSWARLVKRANSLLENLGERIRTLDRELFRCTWNTGKKVLRKMFLAKLASCHITGFLLVSCFVSGVKADLAEEGSFSVTDLPRICPQKLNLASILAALLAQTSDKTDKMRLPMTSSRRLRPAMWVDYEVKQRCPFRCDAVAEYVPTTGRAYHYLMKCLHSLLFVLFLLVIWCDDICSTCPLVIRFLLAGREYSGQQHSQWDYITFQLVRLFYQHHL